MSSTVKCFIIFCIIKYKKNAAVKPWNATDYIIYPDFREVDYWETHILDAKKYSNCLTQYIFFLLSLGRKKNYYLLVSGIKSLFSASLFLGIAM